jgi:hypothetical protein
MRKVFLIYLGMVLASPALSAEEGGRVILTAVIPGESTIVVAAEGDLEPRSIGSYTLRAYAGGNRRFPYDDFLAGTVRPRNGTIETLKFADLNGDASPEIIVVMRSAGTGGYISADAFQLRGSALSLVAAVSALAKDADPIRRLETQMAERGIISKPDAARSPP